MTGLCEDLAAHGLAAWNLEYRRVGNGGGWPGTFDDVAAGVDALAELEAPLDPNGSRPWVTVPAVTLRCGPPLGRAAA